MKLSHRRRFLHLAAGAVALPAMSRIADAQSSTTPSAASHRRRQFLRMAAGAAGLAAVSGRTLAQIYPTQRVIKIMFRRRRAASTTPWRGCWATRSAGRKDRQY
jgi:hypothetical protein